MRETITFVHHAEHAWLHFAIRALIVLLILFLLLVFAGDSLGRVHGCEPPARSCVTLHSNSIYESLGS